MRTGGTLGPDVVVPGSQQLLPAVFLLLTALLAIASTILVIRAWRRSRRRQATRRWVPAIVVAATIAAALTAWLLRPPPFFVPEFGPLPAVTPEDNLFRATVTDLPVSPDSERWISTLAERQLGSGFGGAVVDGVVFGIPYNFVDDDTVRRDVDIALWTDASYPGPYPITDPAYIESMPTYGFDMHYIGIDPTSRQVWELSGTRAWFGRWAADAGAHYRTDSNDYPDGSTIAAGLPLLPGTITWDEVDAGSIDHVVLAGIADSASGEWIWPARGTDGRSSDADAPPQGAWLRLKADTDLSALGPQARVIATALQEHGLILSDTGPGFGLRGTPDRRWDDADLVTLNHLVGSDFEVVDPSGIKVADDTLAVRR